MATVNLSDDDRKTLDELLDGKLTVNQARAKLGLWPLVDVEVGATTTVKKEDVENLDRKVTRLVLDADAREELVERTLSELGIRKCLTMDQREELIQKVRDGEITINAARCLMGFPKHPDDKIVTSGNDRAVRIANGEFDEVDVVKHYNLYKNFEAIDLAEQMPFNLGNVIKYVTRAGAKDPEKLIQDLEKAAWYLNREIQRLKGESV